MRASLGGLLGIFVLLAPIMGASAQQDVPNIPRSPKSGWQDFQIVREPVHPWWHHALWYVPNRVMDLIDVFRVDVGAGPSFGAVVRATRYVQAGYRDFSPGSLRIGDFGRTTPAFIERSSEFGVSPFYTDSPQRNICPGEFGAGLDLLVVGLYVGICFDEVWDFASGILLFDPKDDDRE